MKQLFIQLIPEPGFYYHYKHDKNGAINNYAYEVLGVSKNTEDGTLSVLYRPLYYTAYLDGVNFLNRPLEMFMEDVPFQGMKTPRFSPVKDEKVLAELRKIREEIYGR